MVRRGPKGLSPVQQAAHGETRPSRQVVPLFADHASRPDPDVINPPADMTAAAKRIWISKVDRFKQRGQKVQGVEDALRQYCELEAALKKAFKRGGGAASTAGIGLYEAPAGLVADIADATDHRGMQGLPGTNGIDGASMLYRVRSLATVNVNLAAPGGVPR